MFETTAAFRRRDDARFRSIDGEGVIVLQSAGEVIVVNEVGARVLEELVAGMPFGAILDTLAAEYDVTRPDLEADVSAFVQALLDAGVVECVAPHAPSPNSADAATSAAMASPA